MTLSVPNSCNQRAGFCLVALLASLLGLTATARAAGQWFDPAGVAGDMFGHAMTHLPDVNGDGFDEFLIGVPGSDMSGQDAGQIFLWFGGATVTVAPDRIWNGTSPELFGWSVANIGDVNGDGKEDWAVGAPLSNTGGGPARGRVCVFFGSANPATTPDVIITGENAGDQFGYAVSAAGDYNGDGVDDFIVGAPYNNRRGISAGAAYVIYGVSGQGPASSLATATVMAGEIANDNFGWSVAAAGNFLGGPEACVAVGAPLANTHGGTDAGAVYVFAGRLAGVAPDTTIDFVAGTSANAKPNSQLGYAVQGVGRLNTDAYDDLAVGAPFSNAAGASAGRLEIFYGGPSPAVIAARAINGELATDNFGWSVDRVGDISGTTADDVLIGAPFRDQPFANGGGAYIYEGGSLATGAGSLVSVPIAPIQPGMAPDDHFGFAVAAAGDFDGDGALDYAVAAPDGNIGGTNAVAGFVTLVHSSPGPVAALVRRWQAQWHGRSQVDLTMALSVPAAQLVDFQLTRRLWAGTGMLAGEQLLWSGAARRQDGGGIGELAAAGDGYVFRDDVSALAMTGAVLDYSLVVVASDGTQWHLTDLAGPSPLPIIPDKLLNLAPAWPNPANPAVNIRFRAREGAGVRLQIVDLSGRLVRDLNPGPGRGVWQEVVWRGDTGTGAAAPSGVYLIRLSTGVEFRSERLVLAR